MLGTEHGGLTAGKQALAWVLGQTDVWYLLYRAAHYVSKVHSTQPVQHSTSASVLDDLFTLEEDRLEFPAAVRHNQRLDIELAGWYL